MSILVLSDQLASQIAAGEVVERPASVVKELVENALDAGATVVNVDVREGGRAFIQIADNGHGIPADEVETAFLRHATSKLRSAADLAAIGTLGFRGEALAAIAAVSQTTVVTRTREAAVGVRLTLAGGHITQRESVGAPAGTVIAVENLFYNVPARLKFLKTVATEKRLIDELITRYALAYPHVRFRLTHDGRITFQTSGQGEVREVLAAVYGAELARELVELAEEQRGGGAEEPDSAIPIPHSPIRISGFVAPPNEHRASRQHITLFVNGRWVRDNNLTYAIVQAYHTLLPVGRYPLALIFINLSLEAVDVNVHPAKTEVRFHEGSRVFGAVQKAVRGAVVGQMEVRGIRPFTTLTQLPTWGNSGAASQSFVRPQEWLDDPDMGQMGLELPTAVPPAMPVVGESPPSPPPPQRHLAGDKLPIMRVVGQVGASYIITEGPEGMFLIDQHAAHERIMYEKYMAAYARQAIARQGLVGGAVIQLAPDQSRLLEENLPILAQLGFEIEPFGPQSFVIRAVPAFVATADPVRIVADVVGDLEREATPLQDKIEAKIVRRVCKTATIKAGHTLSTAEMEALVRNLEACDNPHTCPHGRPTLIFLSVAQLAREFGRT